MNKNNLMKLIQGAILGMFVAFSGAGYAASYTTDANLEPILAMIEDGQFETAINHLHDELDADPDNPDIMTLLGFSYRKSRNFDDALTFYEWALKAAPDHKGANEYLGELYLETNQLDKAVQQLEKLDNLCSSNCREYTKLKNAIDTYQVAGSSS
jgi:Flp pilus assembly protein TadD